MELTKITTSSGAVLRILLTLLGHQMFPAAPWAQDSILFIGAVEESGDMTRLVELRTSKKCIKEPRELQMPDMTRRRGCA